MRIFFRIGISTVVLMQLLVSSPYLYWQPVIISGTINSKDLDVIKIVQAGTPINGLHSKTYTLRVSPDGSFSGKLFNVKLGMYKIPDAFVGHTIFVTPGDSVQIDMEKSSQYKFEIFNRLRVKTRYPVHYLFFDSCLSFFGQTKPQFSKTAFDSKSYKEECIEKYSKALALLNHYYELKQVSDSFLKYAQIELKTNYFNWLLFPFAKYKIDKNTSEKSYFKDIDTSSFDDINAFEKTENYLLPASLYNNFILNDIDESDRATWLNSSFNTASTHFRGIARDRLMAWEIEEMITFNSHDSSLLERELSFFFKECKTPYLMNEINVKVGAWAEKIRNTPASFEELLGKEIYSNVQGKLFSLNSLSVNKHWLLIDCWASWCKPCKEQDPFWTYFEQLYHDSIAFLNFSVDEKRVDWENDIRKYRKNPLVNYILMGGNENPFSYFFRIHSIPRYILLDFRKKKIINADMPFPSNKEQFTEAVEKVLVKREF